MIFLSRKRNDGFGRPARVEYQPQENPLLGEHPDESPGGSVDETPLLALELPAERIFFVFLLLHFGQTAILPDVDESVSISNTVLQSPHWNS